MNSDLSNVPDDSTLANSQSISKDSTLLNNRPLSKDPALVNNQAISKDSTTHLQPRPPQKSLINRLFSLPIFPFTFTRRAFLNSAILLLPALLISYIGFLILLILPVSQKTALYAHQFNTGFLWSVSTPEWWGFAENQVTPFYIHSTDGAKLHAWHILPVAAYAANAQELRRNDRWDPDVPFQESPSYQLLQKDPNSKLVVFFHGNAGHLADSTRPEFLRMASALSPHIHVLTIDYRGFGLSTGHPSEQGLISDGIVAVSYALAQLGIPEERIVIVGHSLGSAVASAVALHFSAPTGGGNSTELLQPLNQTTFLTELEHLKPPSLGVDLAKPRTFSKVILVAPFSRLESLLSTYNIGGVIPVLAPLQFIPPVSRFAMSFLREKWNTAARLSALVSANRQSLSSLSSALNIHLIHAFDDLDVSYGHSVSLFNDMAKAGHIALEDSVDHDSDDLGTVQVQGYSEPLSTTAIPDLTHSKPETWRFWKTDMAESYLHIVPFGGHNSILYSTALSSAIMEGCGQIDPVRKLIGSDGQFLGKFWSNSKGRFGGVAPFDTRVYMSWSGVMQMLKRRFSFYEAILRLFRPSL